MGHFINPLRSHNCIDANIADELKVGISPAIQRILELKAVDEIHLLIPHSVRSELQRPGTPAAARAVANEEIFTLPVAITPDEQSRRRKFIEASRGDAKPENIDADLVHVWEVERYGGGYFITNDKRLLSRANIIAKMTMVEVVTSEQFVDQVSAAKKQIEEYKKTSR